MELDAGEIIGAYRQELAQMTERAIVAESLNRDLQKQLSELGDTQRAAQEDVGASTSDE